MSSFKISISQLKSKSHETKNHLNRFLGKCKVLKYLKSYMIVNFLAFDQSYREIAGQKNEKIFFKICQKPRINITTITYCLWEQTDLVRWAPIEEFQSRVPKCAKLLLVRVDLHRAGVREDRLFLVHLRQRLNRSSVEILSGVALL